MAKEYHLFISHSWTYSDKYKGIVTLLKEKSYFSFKNHSVPKDDPVHTSGRDKELIEAIYNKMQGCHVVIVLAGVYATYSKWIKKEIDIANDSFSDPKPILAIEPWGSERTSGLVKQNADKIVKWNSQSIVDGIRDLA